MTVKYFCKVIYSEYDDPDLGGLDMALVAAAKTELKKDGYDVYDIEGGFEVDGEREIDPDYTAPEEIQSDIQITLWKVGDIDADVDIQTLGEEDDTDHSIACL